MTKDELIALQQKVSTLRAEGKYKETIENCNILLENGMEHRDYKSVLMAYLNLVASYYCIGDIEEAFKSLSQHKEICDKYGDEIDKLSSYNNFFLLYEYNKDIEKAKDTLEKCIALGEKLKKYNIVSNAYSNYSHICFIAEEYDLALEKALEGLKMAREHKPYTPILELRVKLNIAKAHIALKDFDESKALIDEIINDPILDSYIREKVQCYDLQGQWYSKQNLYMDAFKAFTQAKTLVESYNDVYLLKAIQEERCKLCELMGEINLGYKVQKEMISLLNEISHRELSLTALKLEVKHYVASIEKRANFDFLTGIYNRDYMENTANNWLQSAYKKNESIIGIVFDIDSFKSINDEYGHLFGDEVIKEVSKACSNIIRKNDLLGRYGGDEFVIILKDISLEAGQKKAEQILQSVRDLKIYRDGKLIPITLSIGVADNLDCAARQFSELFNAADRRLYIAKQNGKNQVCAVS